MKNKSFMAGTVLWFAIAAAVLAADRIIKTWIMANCTPGEIFGELPFVSDFIYVKNTGAAFSLLSGSTGILSAVSVLFCIAAVVFWIIKKPAHTLLRAAVSMLFAGALGNAVDRIVYGYVVDFISIKWFDFPVFNIADIAIVIGAAAAVVYVFFFDKPEKTEEKDGRDRADS